MDSSIEIYKIVLSHDYTFSKLVNEKWKNYGENDLDETSAFIRLYEKLLSELVGNGVWQSKKSVKKGLAVMNTDRKQQEETIKEILKSHSQSSIIEGFIDAGTFNVKRKMATYTNTANKENVPREKIVTDAFYFYLYIRMNSNKAILMIEAKKGVYMSNIFTEFVTKLFSISKKCRCDSEAFMPKALKDAYKNSSIIKSITCSTQMASSVRINDADENEQFKITVRVEPVNNYSFNNRQTVIDSAMQMMVKVGNVFKPLLDFDNKKGEMKNETHKNTRAFDLADPDVVPKMTLTDEMYDEENTILHRNLIFDECNRLLLDIQREVYLVNPIVNQD